MTTTGAKTDQAIIAPSADVEEKPWYDLMDDPRTARGRDAAIQNHTCCDVRTSGAL